MYKQYSYTIYKVINKMPVFISVSNTVYIKRDSINYLKYNDIYKYACNSIELMVT